ncbi:hypothetical protein [Nocardioides litoris]|uniref:hypothetical protein n=1 Tax=Nocardioides litoris TaxID=1926648 RepID=UPI001B87E2D1|nr:hypothetical protein [Nocardioides litoris]
MRSRAPPAGTGDTGTEDTVADEVGMVGVAGLAGVVQLVEISTVTFPTISVLLMGSNQAAAGCGSPCDGVCADAGHGLRHS